MDELVEMFKRVTINGVAEQKDSLSVEEGEVGVWSTPKVGSGSIKELSLLWFLFF
jgi:hypothetical protein